MKQSFLLLLAVLLTGMSCREKRLPYNDDYTAIAGFEHCNKWGAFNVSSPCCVFSNKEYYLFSEDFCAGSCNEQVTKYERQNGVIQLRTSPDLINWKYIGCVIRRLPPDALQYIDSLPANETVRKIPVVIKNNGVYRMYLSLQCENAGSSWMGLFESDKITGTWKYKGKIHFPENTILKGSITTLFSINGKEQWMIYNSAKEGLHCIKINSKTGLPDNSNNSGALISKKQNSCSNPAAPFIFYNRRTGYYYLFVSYGPEITTYNVRTGRSKTLQGPYLDYYGNDISTHDDHYPVLIHPYAFNHHTGWAGAGSLSVIRNSENDYFAVHQARLSPDNVLSLLHIRKIYWSKDGWPVLSPERYAGIDESTVSKAEISGCWEIIVIKPSLYKRTTNNNGQILEGENRLAEEEVCRSSIYELNNNGSISNSAQGRWSFDENSSLSLQIGNFNAKNLILHRGFDWENNCKTILLTGLDDNGYSIWGKRIHPTK